LLRRVVRDRGFLEAGQNGIAHRQRIAEVLQRERVQLGATVAEEIVDAARGENQEVITQIAGIGVDLTAFYVDTGHIGHPQFEVADRAQDPAQRVRDLRWVEEGGSHLVQQGGEEVVVVAVDQHDIDVSPAQPAGDSEPSEARADDHDALPRHGQTVVGGWRVSQARRRQDG
jgi:hypothetical protein